MKRILLSGLLATSLGAPAFAGSISLDTRTDFEAVQYNDAAKAATPNLSNYNRFNMQTLRLDAKGNFDELTTFRLRFRLNRAMGTPNKRDSVTDAIDFALVQRKLSDNVSLGVGKFITDIGGWEGMTSGPDLYLQSQSYQMQNPLRYATGAKLIYTLDNHEFTLLSTNQQTDALDNGITTGSATGQFNQTRLTTGLVYKAAYMEKTLNTVLSYHQDKIQPSADVGTTTGATTREREASYIAAGVKYDFAPYFVELDYLMDNWKNQSAQDQTDKVNTIVGTLGAKMDNYVAKVKLENSEVDAFSTTANAHAKTKYSGYQVALEYMPTGDKNFRYHVAYVSRDTKPATGDTRNTQTVVAGVRLLADFLK